MLMISQLEHAGTLDVKHDMCGDGYIPLKGLPYYSTLVKMPDGLITLFLPADCVLNINCCPCSA